MRKILFLCSCLIFLFIKSEAKSTGFLKSGTNRVFNTIQTDSIAKVSAVDTSSVSSDYALIHIYRRSGVGALVGYDLYLGDSVICRVKNKWKKTLKIRKDGLNMIWARTEIKKELPVNIKFGNEYYIRCSITMGAFVGHPKLELVDNETGKAEYDAIKLSKRDKRDYVTLSDGREIECIIQKEDDENVYVIVFKDGMEINTQIDKKQIKSIQKSE